MKRRGVTNEPMGFPRGTVRAALTLLLVVVCAVMLFVPVVNEQAASMFLLLTGIAVRDYFAQRADQNREDGPSVGPPAVGD